MEDLCLRVSVRKLVGRINFSTHTLKKDPKYKSDHKNYHKFKATKIFY